MNKEGVRAWLTHTGTSVGVVLREVEIEGRTYYRPENGPAIGLDPGESMEVRIIIPEGKNE